MNSIGPTYETGSLVLYQDCSTVPVEQILQYLVEVFNARPFIWREITEIIFREMVTLPEQSAVV